MRYFDRVIARYIDRDRMRSGTERRLVGRAVAIPRLRFLDGPNKRRSRPGNILAQELVPGQRLVEMELASQFGVGRNSVREAFHRLAAEGLVNLFRNRGAAIRIVSLKETMDVLDVAERMTGLLARTAARGAIDRKLIRTLTDVLKELTKSADKEDTDGFARGRRQFYRALLAHSGSSELKRLFPAIQMPIVYAQHRLPGLHRQRLRDYRLIAKAVSAGLEAEADEAGMAHVRTVRQLVLDKAAAKGS